MTGGWKRELAKLDDVTPPPSRPHERPPAVVAPSRRSRVLAGLVACSIVGLGAFWFVSAYRSADPASPPAGSAPPTAQEAISYEDPLGWSVDHPPDWSVLPIDWFDGRTSTTGVALSNEQLPPASDLGGEGSPWPDLSRLTHRGVVLIVTHHVGGPAPSVGDDSSFPLDPSDAQVIPGDSPASSVLVFRGDGLEFTARFGGYADAPPELHSVLDDMIRSIRFQPWANGEERNGFEAVGEHVRDGRAGSTLVQRSNLVYVMKQGPGRPYLLDVPELNCEGQNQDWDAAAQELLMESPCFPDVRYDVDGMPHPANPPQFSEPIERSELIRAWDGTLLLPP